MSVIFLKISDIKKTAFSQYNQYKIRQDYGKKIISSIMGGPIINREWFRKARDLYSYAQTLDNDKKCKYLTSALVEIYKSEFSLSESKFNDESILALKEKIETSYFNFIINYLEETLVKKKKIRHNIENIENAIIVLNERFHKIAKKYSSIVSRFHNQSAIETKISNFIEIPVQEFTDRDTSLIKSSLLSNQKYLKMNPTNEDKILSQLRYKFDRVFSYYLDLYENEKNLANPSIKKIIKIIENYELIYTPLKKYIPSERYSEFIQRKNNYLDYYNFFQNNYNELKKMYNYLSLPRENLKINSIIRLINLAYSFNEIKDANYIEFQNIDPSLEEITLTLENSLTEYYKEDLINYYKIYNEIINSEETELKINEMINFLKFIQTEAQKHKKSSFMVEKISTLENQTKEWLYSILNNQLIDRIKKSSGTSQIKKAFDYVLNKYITLNNIETIEYLQNSKKELLDSIATYEGLKVGIKDDLQNYIDENRVALLPINLLEKISDFLKIQPILMKFKYSDISEFTEYINEVKKNMEYSKDFKPKRLVIIDKFSPYNLVVFTQKRIEIGRNKDNDISLNIDCVSSHHCTLDLASLTLRDNNSTNGTYCNGIEGQIKEIKFDQINKFNLAETVFFSFNFKKSNLIFKIEQVMSDESNLTQDYINTLTNTCFVWLDNGGSLFLDSNTGKIDEMEKTQSIKITNDSGTFYFSDPTNLQNHIEIAYNNEKLSDRFSFYISS